MSASPILWSYALSSTPLQPLTEEEAVREIESERAAWAHLDANHPHVEQWLHNHVSYLPDLTIDALIAEETRPRADAYENGILLILRGVNLNEGADPEDMVSLRVWLDPHRVISMRKRTVRAAHMLSESLQAGTGPDSASAFLSRIIANLLEVMEPVFGDMEEQLDALEEELIESPHSGLRHQITLLRRRALQLRRYISPQRDAIAKLRFIELDWITAQDKLSLNESYDRITRYIEHLDAIRERCQIVQDELSTVLADKLNRNTYVLTLIAAIFLPLGFLTGLLGINVGGMPGAENGDAFWYVCALCATISAVEIILFKKLRWL